MSELFAQRLIGPLASLEETGTFSPGVWLFSLGLPKHNSSR